MENVTDLIVGVVLLTHDDPANLTVQIEPPIVTPRVEGTVEQIEACFLLIDRLFALGYRRVQFSVDSQDVASKKLAGNIGFTHEATMPKDRIVREASRNSNVYGMLNSDWDRGARNLLYKKLHGAALQKVDADNNAREGDWEEQLQMLRERKEMAAQEETEDSEKKA